MTCKHCSEPATEGIFCLKHFNAECNALIARLKDPQRIPIARMERDMKLAREHMETRRVFDFRLN